MKHPIFSRFISTKLAAAAAFTLCFSALPFHTDASQPKELFTLGKAIETALAHNIDLLQGENQITAKMIDVTQQKAQFHPDLSASGQMSRQVGKTPNADTGVYESQGVTTAGATVTGRLNLFNGFHDISALKKSRTELEAVRADTSRLRESIIYEAVSRYIEVVAAEELVRTEEENLEAQREQLKLINAFFSAGRRPLADLYLQQAETARAEYRLLNAQRTVRVNTHILLEFMGMDPGTPCRFSNIKIDGNVKEQPQIPDTAGEVNESLTRRQDYLAQQGWIDAAREGIRTARSGYWPSVDLSLSAGTSYNSLSADLYPFDQQVWENNLYISMGLSISLPLYDRSTTAAQVARARLSLENEQLSGEKLKLQISTQVRQAVEDLHTSIKELEVAESQLKYSRQSLDSHEERYRVGAATLAELSLARSQQLQADYDWIIARHTLFLRRVGLGYHRGDTEAMLAVVSDGDSVEHVRIDTTSPGGQK